jgi:hypothetical protein
MLNRNWSCNCKKIVENHNGEITVKSKLNKGTTFDIYLPKTKKLMENQTFVFLPMMMKATDLFYRCI